LPRYLEGILSEGDFDAIGEVVAADYREHDPANEVDTVPSLPDAPTMQTRMAGSPLQDDERAGPSIPIRRRARHPPFSASPIRRKYVGTTPSETVTQVVYRSPRPFGRVRGRARSTQMLRVVRPLRGPCERLRSPARGARSGRSAVAVATVRSWSFFVVPGTEPRPTLFPAALVHLRLASAAALAASDQQRAASPDPHPVEEHAGQRVELDSSRPR
jgi:hypothetical protein